MHESHYKTLSAPYNKPKQSPLSNITINTNSKKLNYNFLEDTATDNNFIDIIDNINKDKVLSKERIKIPSSNFDNLTNPLNNKTGSNINIQHHYNLSNNTLNSQNFPYSNINKSGVETSNYKKEQFKTFDPYINEDKAHDTSLLDSQIMVENTYLKYRLEEVNQSKIDLLMQIKQKEQEVSEVKSFLKEERQKNRKLVKTSSFNDNQKAEILSLQKNNERLEEQIKGLTSSIKDLNDTIGNKENIINELQSCIDMAQSKFYEYEENIVNQNKTISSLKDQILHYEYSITNISNVNESLKEENLYLKDELQKNKTQLAVISAEHEEAINKAIKNKEEEHKAKFQIKEENLKDEFSKEISKLQNLISSLSFENEKFKLSVIQKDSYDLEFKSLNEQKILLENEIKDKTKQEEKLLKQLKENKSIIEEMNKEILALKEAVLRKDEEAKKFKSKINSINLEVKNRQIENSKLNNQIQHLINLTNKTNDSNSPLLELMEKYNKKEEENIKLSHSIKALSIDNDGKEREILNLRNEVNEINNDLDKRRTYEYQRLERELILEINKRNELEMKYEKLKLDKDKTVKSNEGNSSLYKLSSISVNFNEELLKERLLIKVEEIKNLKNLIYSVKEKLNEIINTYGMYLKLPVHYLNDHQNLKENKERKDIVGIIGLVNKVLELLTF